MAVSVAIDPEIERPSSTRHERRRVVSRKTGCAPYRRQGDCREAEQASRLSAKQHGRFGYSLVKRALFASTAPGSRPAPTLVN